MLSYNYPTLSQAEEAGLELYHQLTSGTRQVPQMAQAGYCLVGFGLSQGLPVPRVNAMLPEECEAKLCEALKPLTLKGADPAGLAIPWAVILPLVFQLLSKWLSG